MAELPKVGDRIAVEKLHVSKTNVRYGEPFGKTEEDKQFKEHLRFNPIRVPIKARPEGKGFGVYVGRRRFLSKKDYTTHFTVGKDLLIFDVSEEEARMDSFIENNEYLKKNMDSITYAENLNLIMTRGGGSLRATAKRVGIGASTLSEYLKILELSPKLREAVRQGLIPFKGKGGKRGALELAKLKLPTIQQEELANLLTSEGPEAFWRELSNRLGTKKRGLPKDAYDVDRVTWRKNNKFDQQHIKIITKAAENMGMTRPEYTKDFMIRHIDEIEKEAKA